MSASQLPAPPLICASLRTVRERSASCQGLRSSLANGASLHLATQMAGGGLAAALGGPPRTAAPGPVATVVAAGLPRALTDDAVPAKAAGLPPPAA